MNDLLSGGGLVVISSLGSMFKKGSKILEGTVSWLQEMSQEVFPYILILLFYDGEVFDGLSYILSDGIFPLIL